ncbi:MAG: hypothetical protein ISP01_02460 [Methanobrevibacter arboriphilus]|uniref:Uncharacterized protein n=1 Tax=Methanobrevibacter arboriphilus TaxID=39441 RepID=A0A843AGL2_METAZ|nr:hypothetical protein [Methanobrevibacter arboriphilus]MBF4468246.1 hypothetical protein [Methanobrevibacter arboriphilus]
MKNEVDKLINKKDIYKNIINCKSNDDLIIFKFRPKNNDKLIWDFSNNGLFKNI